MGTDALSLYTNYKKDNSSRGKPYPCIFVERSRRTYIQTILTIIKNMLNLINLESELHPREEPMLNYESILYIAQSSAMQLLQEDVNQDKEEEDDPSQNKK